MKVEMWPIERVRPYERNPRVNDQAVEAVAGSIRSYGFRQPLVVTPDGEIICGHTRYKAAKQLELKEVPVHVAEGLTTAQVRALRVADNKTAELAEWDMDLLPIELAELQGLDIDLGLLGFDEDELATLLGAGINEGLTDPDDVPEPPDDPVTKQGDLWILGEHRLLCGDSSCEADVDRLLDGADIHLVNTDPPYNVKVEPRSNNAIAAGLSSFAAPPGKHHQKFDLARHPEKSKATHRKMRAKDRPLINDFVSDEDFDKLLRAWFGQMARVLLPGRGFYIWGGYSNLGNYPPALKASGLYFSQAIIWDKQHPVLTRKDFLGAFEVAYYGWREGAGHKFFGPNNVTDLWPIKKVNPQAMSHLCLHPDTTVLTEASFRPIREIRPGDRVYSGDGTFHAVTHVSSHLYASDYLYRITARGGNATTDASDNHPFLIWRPTRRHGAITASEVSWMRADEIKPGDYTMTPLPQVPTGDLLPDTEGRPVIIDHEGREYSLRYVKSVERVPYEGEVVNLSVEGHPSFQTAVGLSHNTEKPVELAVRAIQYSSRPGENVLDLFGGSGSTLIGAEQTGRHAYLMEIDPAYADVIVQRWEAFAGGKAQRGSARP